VVFGSCDFCSRDLSRPSKSGGGVKMGVIEIGNRGTKLCGFGRLLSEVCGGVL